MIVLKRNSNNFSIKVGKSYIPIEESLIPYMCDEIQLEKGVTFEDFFNIILRHHEYYSEVFCSHLSGVQLSHFLKEWIQPIKKNVPDTYRDIEKLIIAWENIGILDKKELLDEELGIEINWLPSFSGVGKDAAGYAIEFTPLNELKKYPLELSPNTTIYNLKTDEKLVFMSRNFTVYEVLSAIFYEITFVGSPEVRKKKLDDLVQRKQEAEKQFTQGDTTTLDDILKKLKIDKPKEEDL